MAKSGRRGAEGSTLLFETAAGAAVRPAAGSDQPSAELKNLASGGHHDPAARASASELEPCPLSLGAASARGGSLGGLSRLEFASRALRSGRSL